MTGKVRFRSDLIQFENIESMSYRVGENFTEMSIYLALASKEEFKQSLLKSYHQQTRFPKYSFLLCYDALSTGVYHIVAQVPIIRHLLSL